MVNIPAKHQYVSILIEHVSVPTLAYHLAALFLLPHRASLMAVVLLKQIFNFDCDLSFKDYSYAATVIYVAITYEL